MHFAYVLYSYSLNRFYKGSTADVRDRLVRHNRGREKATRAGIPWIMIWVAEKNSRSEAIKLEYKLKNLSRKRLISLMIKYRSEVAGPDELMLLHQFVGILTRASEFESRPVRIIRYLKGCRPYAYNLSYFAKV
ncbi:MAG: GIY-YIG nuclease family protein [Bacteroidetes bacterium]|nr:GIY-YIG nuclease family protein [Bacteroidota bacterium]